MGLFLSVLVASVGAMDLINCLALVTNQFVAPERPAVDEDLERYRRLLKEQIETVPRSSVERLTYAQDGVLYKDGYRVEKFDDDRLDRLNVKIKELERTSQEKDHKLDQLNVKLQELERKSAERELLGADFRSRSVSRAESLEPTTSKYPGVSQEVPQIVLDDNDSRSGSRKFRPILREDEFRRTIKQRSISSNVSEDRSEELEILSQMEEEEARKMDDYVPLVYSREEHMEMGAKRHKISPIQELCQLHEEEDSHRYIERSPEPTLAVGVTRPWGDINPEDSKERKRIRPDRSLSIEEETRDSDSGAVQESEISVKNIKEANQWLQTPQKSLSTSESVPSNLSSHSNSPDPEYPTLKRTRKKSNLTALLLEEEHKSEARTGVVIQMEESDSDGTKRTEFMQSKSPSPYVGAFLEPEQIQSTNHLVPLVLERPKSPTPDHDMRSFSEEYQLSPTASPPRDASRKATDSPVAASPPEGPSREVTISPVAVGSSGSPASPISSIVDESTTDGPQQIDADRSASSPVQSEGNVSRDGSVSFASTDASAASLDMHVDQALQLPSSPTPPPPSPTPPPPPPIQSVDAASDLELCGVDQKASKSPSKSPVTMPGATKPTPPRRFRTRTRKVRSLTPIDFNQTFMDAFSEQRVCVSPSELEDYINSLDEIKIEPPKPVVPNYFIPTTPLTSGVPSLLVTDEKGAEARFHDSLSSKSFYGKDTADSTCVPNHRVSYVEWIKKFPENMTSHLELEDYDSDDEEVENIINNSKTSPVSASTEQVMLPTNGSVSTSPSPRPAQDVPISPTVVLVKPAEQNTEFSLNVVPSSATPSPVSVKSEISLSSESVPMGSPLLNSLASPSHHFSPIDSPLPSLNSSSPDPQESLHSLPKLFVPSRSPTPSPVPPDMTADEMVYDIGHLEGLIFETPSRSPTPSLQSSSAKTNLLLSPEELAYDIGNLGGLILGPPSRSVSPLPVSSSPTPGSSLSSPWTSLQIPSDAETPTGLSEQNTSLHNTNITKNNTKSNED